MGELCGRPVCDAKDGMLTSERLLKFDIISDTCWVANAKRSAGCQNRVRTIIASVVKGLQAAHNTGIAKRGVIMHRDIKLANVVWSEDEKICKMIDFGLAKELDESRKTDTMLGTAGM